MFLKKYVKDDKVYYLLTLVILSEKGSKPEFKKCFIPEALAKWLIKSGVVCINDKEKIKD